MFNRCFHKLFLTDVLNFKSVAHLSNSFGTWQFKLCSGSFLERAQEVIFIQMEQSCKSFAVVQSQVGKQLFS